MKRIDKGFILPIAEILPRPTKHSVLSEIAA